MTLRNKEGGRKGINGVGSGSEKRVEDEEEEQEVDVGGVWVVCAVESGKERNEQEAEEFREGGSMDQGGKE